jgi:putative transposase
MVDFRRKHIRLSPERYVGRQWYFLTLCTENREHRFSEAATVALVLELLREGCEVSDFGLWAYCFMPDHLHVLVAGENEGARLLPFLKTLKQKSAYRFKRQTAGSLWQKKPYDHILRETERWEAVAWYIWMNPARAGLCVRPEDWPFSGSFKVDWRRMLAPPKHPWRPS